MKGTQFKLILPEEVKEWISEEAKRNFRSQSAEIVQRLSAQMTEQEKAPPLTAARPMSEAPRDGTRVLAWWPELPNDSDNYGWATTWWGKAYGSSAEGWECPWEWERPESDWAPTHWLPHPPQPEANP